MDILSIIPQLILFVGLAVIVVIVVRRLPKVKDVGAKKTTSENNGTRRHFADVWREKMAIMKKRSAVWAQTLKLKKVQNKEAIDMKAESNIRSLGQTERPHEELAKTNRPKTDQALSARGKNVADKAKNLFRTPFSKAKRSHNGEKPTAMETPENAMPAERRERGRMEPPAPREIARSPYPDVSLRHPIAPAPSKLKDPAILREEEQIYVKRIIENPKDIESYKALAEIYTQQENDADAIHSLEEVLKRNPNDLISEEKLIALRKRQDERASLAQR